MKEELLVPLVGGVVVAVIAGAISLSVAILSKDQKTSEFRQLWIDALRQDVSRLSGVLHMLIGMSNIISEQTDDQKANFLVSSKDNLIEMVDLVTRIRLRLNIKEHVVLLALLDEVSNSKDMSRQAMESQIEAVVTEVQKVLKNEWERVKRGERSFQILKWSSGFVLVLGLAGVGVYYYLT
ncbi:hypothetical protein [Pseudomonas orientalis]|uniref:Uncharacterized protein n=1 Tax=Pseudomonas orientalis TaxID=76758 RepID=A0A2L0RY46_9PSED|nr:hypothetical protein [Pseudomonas orientalis]AUZ46866.1 hypothetical protein BOP93_15075 [Pseudomonas orientalis]